jgi:hypothetical protein
MHLGRKRRIAYGGELAGIVGCALILCGWSLSECRSVWYAQSGLHVHLECGVIRFGRTTWSGDARAVVTLDAAARGDDGLSVGSTNKLGSLRENVGLVLPWVYRWSVSEYTDIAGAVRGPMVRRHTVVTVPLWAILLVMVPIVCVARRRARPLPRGRCEACGYDLTGNTSGRCSECGATVRRDDHAVYASSPGRSLMRPFVLCWGILIVAALPLALLAYVEAFARPPATAGTWAVALLVGTVLLAPFTWIAAAGLSLAYLVVNRRRRRRDRVSLAQAHGPASR